MAVVGGEEVKHGARTLCLDFLVLRGEIKEKNETKRNETARGCKVRDDEVTI